MLAPVKKGGVLAPVKKGGVLAPVKKGGVLVPVCLLYISDAADALLCVDCVGRGPS